MHKAVQQTVIKQDHLTRWGLKIWLRFTTRSFHMHLPNENVDNWLKFHKTVLNFVINLQVRIGSIWVQVTAWLCQATSHHLSQCWPRSMLSYDVTGLFMVSLICTWLNCANNTSSTGMTHHVQTCVNSPPPWTNGRHFADDIFRCIFENEKCCILIKILLKFSPKSPIDNNQALV